MARYTGPSCRLCRRAGEKLFLKGERCYTPKCAVEKRRRAPGDHLPRRRRISDWGIQLREKQKARQSYGILERQFLGYFTEARRDPGVTGDNLLQFLERLLDNVVYRLGFSSSRQQARQIVLHGHITVNGKKVNIPSYRVRAGESLGWKEAAREKPFYELMVRSVGQRPVPTWLDLDRKTMIANVVRNPEGNDMDATFNTRLIVEHYSR